MLSAKIFSVAAPLFRWLALLCLGYQYPPLTHSRRRARLQPLLRQSIADDPGAPDAVLIVTNLRKHLSPAGRNISPS